MAREIGPKHKACRREGLSICGIPARCPVVTRNAAPPGQHGASRRRRPSDYRVRLREKQKVKSIYGVLEKQFRRYYQTATKHSGVTGEELLRILERRLDNALYRLGLAKTRSMARQFIVHGHVRIDGAKIDRPSYLVKKGQLVSLDDKVVKSTMMQSLLTQQVNLPSWLERKATVGKIVDYPPRGDITEDIDESLIVEFYG